MRPLTRDKFQELSWEVLPHPAYSTDLVPSDFYPFRLIKDALLVKRFGNTEDVKEVVQNRLRDQSKEFFTKELGKLQERWDKYIHVEGDYDSK